jgi:hypothetical protein
MIPVASGVRVWDRDGPHRHAPGHEHAGLLVQEALKRDPHICGGTDYVAAGSSRAFAFNKVRGFAAT